VQKYTIVLQTPNFFKEKLHFVLISCFFKLKGSHFFWFYTDFLYFCTKIENIQ